MEISDGIFLPGQERVVFSPSRSERNDPADPSMFKMVLPSLGQDGQMSYSIDWANRPPQLFPYSSEPNDDWVIGTIAILREERELPELPDSILWRANLVPYRQGGHARAPPVEEVWPEIDDDEWGRVQAEMDQRLAREDAEQRQREQLVNAAELAAMHDGQGWNQPRGRQAAQQVHGGNDWLREQILRRDPREAALDDLLANIEANRDRLQQPAGYPRDDDPEDDRRIDEQGGGGGRTRTKKSKKRRPTRRIRHRRGSSKRKVRKSSRKARATRRK